MRDIARVLSAAFKKNVLEYVRYPVNMVFSFIMPVVSKLIVDPSEKVNLLDLIIS